MDDLSLMVVVAACAKNDEYVDNWLRLRGYTLPASAIERMIDESSGHGEAIAKQFIADVRELFEFRVPGVAIRTPDTGDGHE